MDNDEVYLSTVLRMIGRSDLRVESKEAITNYLEEFLVKIGQVRVIARQILTLSEVQDDHQANLDHYGDPPEDAYFLAQLLLEKIGDDNVH